MLLVNLSSSTYKCLLSKYIYFIIDPSHQTITFINLYLKILMKNIFAEGSNKKQRLIAEMHLTHNLSVETNCSLWKLPFDDLITMFLPFIFMILIHPSIQFILAITATTTNLLRMWSFTMFIIIKFYMCIKFFRAYV